MSNNLLVCRALNAGIDGPGIDLYNRSIRAYYVYGGSMSRRYSRVAVLLVFIASCLGAGHAPNAGAEVPLGPDGPPVPAETYTGTKFAVRWGFYINYNPNSWDSLQANAKNLNYVSPWFFYVNKEGQVTGNNEARVTTLLKQAGVKNLPMVQNSAQYNDFTPALSDPGKQASLVDQLERLVEANGYDGITIDFEGVNATDRPALTAFMGALYARFHPKGKLVAMAVAAKTTDSGTGWSAPYDYDALASVLDYMLVMAYDYHWSTSEPGAVAPINSLRRTAAYTVEHVPAKKVIWGVGVYGYDWERKGVPTLTATRTPSGTPPTTSTPTMTRTPTMTPTRPGPGTPTVTPAPAGKAEYRSYAEAMSAAGTQGAQSGYDATAEAPWVMYYRDGRQREIWFENRRSFDVKMGLIERYGMAGFGIWRLGQEDPKVWETIISAGPPVACRPIKEFKSTAAKVYFPQTRHSLTGPFLRYWQQKGGLPIFGYPLTEEFTEISHTNGKRYKVQYFERNRFEYHPENKAPNDVQLGLLGVQVTAGRAFEPASSPVPGPDTVFFPQVKHTLSGQFFKHWQDNGGLGQFGYPISEPVMEQSRIDGKTYTVQYLQRARFELHSLADPQPNTIVLLGLLGLDVLPCN
ncbi:MAG TPA: glycosyl hydrolase family 18 protein [Chloroflexia bacterium]|nr:glycosyl hydrolase family 18 protein [Chloroflexia bacterium]